VNDISFAEQGVFFDNQLSIPALIVYKKVLYALLLLTIVPISCQFFTKRAGGNIFVEQFIIY
jgi:hypothetical protein